MRQDLFIERIKEKKSLKKKIKAILLMWYQEKSFFLFLFFICNYNCQFNEQMDIENNQNSITTRTINSCKPS